MKKRVFAFLSFLFLSSLLMAWNNPFDNVDFRENFMKNIKDMPYGFKSSKGIVFKKYAPRKTFVTKQPLGMGCTSYLEELDGKLCYISEWQIGDSNQAKIVFSDLDIGVNRTASLNGFRLDYSKKHQDDPFYHYYFVEEIPRDMNPALKDLKVELKKEIILKGKMKVSHIKMILSLGRKEMD